MTEDLGLGRGIVLVVDDSPDTLGMLIEALEAAGLTTLVARDGMAALDLLTRVEPDVILLNAVMPGIDGFETCRRIKQRPALATTPVVFMTGLSDRAHVAEALRAGGVDYVTKPVASDELIARIAVHVVNARLITDARRALDAAGRGVAALSPDGAVVWATPRAEALLAGLIDRPDTTTRLSRWLATVGGAERGAGGQRARRRSPGLALAGQIQPRHCGVPVAQPAHGHQACRDHFRQDRRGEPHSRSGEGDPRAEPVTGVTAPCGFGPKAESIGAFQSDMRCALLREP